MSERCERTSEWKSEWPVTYVWILDYSGPPCKYMYRGGTSDATTSSSLMSHGSIAYDISGGFFTLIISHIRCSILTGDGRVDRRTETTSYRDATAHLKTTSQLTIKIVMAPIKKAFPLVNTVSFVMAQSNFPYSPYTICTHNSLRSAYVNVGSIFFFFFLSGNLA